MIASIVLLFCVLATPSLAAAAYNPFQGLNCGSGAQRGSTVCQTGQGDPVTGPNGVIRRVTNLFAVVAGVGAVIVLVLAGIRYITSSGDPSQISQSKQAIIFALVGLVVIFVSQSVINFIILRV